MRTGRQDRTAAPDIFSAACLRKRVNPSLSFLSVPSFLSSEEQIVHKLAWMYEMGVRERRRGH